MKDKRYFLSISLITVAILALGTFFWCSGTMSLDDTAESAMTWSLGGEDAPVVIDMYPDFNCASCLEKERYAIQAYSVYQGKIRLVYHHYPGTALSEMICLALEAAGEQNQFWEMHNRLINDDPADIATMISSAGSNGEDITDFTLASLMDIAKAMSLDMAAFDVAMNDEAVVSAIRESKQKAVDAGVISVALFVNGTEYTTNSGPVEEFYTVIDEELERVENDVD